MKALIILGALIGFLIGSGFGLASHSPWPDAIWRACAAALLAAFLTRWWTRIWLQGLRQSLEEQRQAAATVSAPTQEKPKAKV